MFKRNFFFTMIFCSMLLISLAQADWSEPVEIGIGTGPDLDINTKTGELHVVSVALSGNIQYTKMDRDGNILDQEFVPGVTGERGRGYFGPSIAVDTAGYAHIAYRIEDEELYFDLYYIHQTATGWSTPILVANDVYRGYCFRIDIDDANRVHLAYGTGGDDVWGPVTYVRIEDDAIVDTQTNITKYRTDDRIEIDSRGSSDVEIILGCPDPDGGPISYWRSTNSGDNFSYVGDIHADDASDRNGSPDIFRDNNGTVHIVYGAGEDESLNRNPSVRYAKYQNGVKIFDIPVTGRYTLTEWKQNLGLASVAATDYGQDVVVAYQETDGGKLYTSHSSDGGQTWNAGVLHSSDLFDGYEGRNKHVLRAYQNRFYMVYPGDAEEIHFTWWEIEDTEAPVADAGGPYQSYEGRTITFDASNSTDNMGIVSFRWDWEGDGTFDITTTNPTISHQYNDEFSGRVILEVKDIANATDMDSATVTILNAAPTITLADSIFGNEAENISFTATVVDSGANDTFDVMWHFTDTDSASGLSVSFTFPDNGVYPVQIIATDNDGGVSRDTVQVKVNNVAPVADAGGPYLVASNDTVTFTGSATDVSPADTEFTYAWDLDGNGSYESVGKIVKKHVLIGGEFSIGLRVTDKDGGVGTDETTLMITNTAPKIGTIPAQLIKEGQSFSNIQLDNYVTDDENPAEQISWRTAETTNITISIVNRVASVTQVDPAWRGKESIKFYASDPSGASDSATVQFGYDLVNDPPQALTIPAQTIDENGSFQTIQLNQYVTDDESTPEEMTWTYFGANALLVEVSKTDALTKTGPTKPSPANAVVWTATIAVADSEWSGQEKISFVVTDPEQLSDTTQVTFTVNPVNDAPIFNKIPEQIIGSGQTFPVLNLNNYAFDPDDEPASLTWSFQAADYMSVDLNGALVTVTAPSAEWEGSDAIIFKVEDPAGLSAQQEVVFTVNLANKAPVISQMTDLTLNEDDSVKIARQTLVNLVTDQDNSDDDFEFSLLPSSNIFWSIDETDQGMWIQPVLNWHGSELATLVVHDGLGGRDSTHFTITVNSMPDAPNPFQLISPLNEVYTSQPQSIDFTWEKTDHPDGYDVFYVWLFSRYSNFADTLSLKQTVDTTYTMNSTAIAQLSGYYYYWKVYAFTFNDELIRESKNSGQIQFSETGVELSSSSELPEKFALLQNHPNPFNPKTQITYHLPKDSHVHLAIYNLLGERVRDLDFGTKTAGIHSVIWDAKDDAGQLISSGIYIYRFQAGEQVFVKKMMLMK